MTIPRADPEADRQKSLRLAARATQKRIDAERTEAAAFAFAADLGASLRDIAAASGVPHMTVRRHIAATNGTIGRDEDDGPKRGC